MSWDGMGLLPVEDHGEWLVCEYGLPSSSYADNLASSFDVLTPRIQVTRGVLSNLLVS